MKYATVEDVISSFPHSILSMVQGEQDYQTIHAIWKLLQAKAWEIYTHLGGGLRNLGLVVLDAAYAMVAPATEAGPILWVNPTSPGRAPENVDEGTVAQLSAARHVWEEAVLTFRTFNTVQQALKKQIITVFEPMYLDILNYDMVGFANISACEMLDRLFMTYVNSFWSTISSRCVEHGTHSNLGSPFSRKSKTAPTFLWLVVSSSGIHSR
jgi:hypothetical protein